LLTGAEGQAGSAIRACAPSGTTLLPLGSAALDITNASAVSAIVEAFQPNVIVNAAAYTAVDRAESDIDRAYQVNRDGARILATAARQSGIRLVHLSTDYVFDGRTTTPYPPDAPCRPLNVYGASKRAGEEAVLESGAGLVLRTSWLYAARRQNFVSSMLRRLGEDTEVRVVRDETGSPTWAGGLAAAIWAAVDLPSASGIAHWADAGAVSREGFARAIHDEARSLGLLRRSVRIVPIDSAELGLAARRPAYSVLDTTTTQEMLKLPAAGWRDNLQRMLRGLCREEEQ
jgi:dTDP-4-dehydrorhamnose reductase